jgi:predicted transcriptional regulator
MKTIAITIDPETLRRLDELAARLPQRPNRSALVRAAIREFAEREQQRLQDALEAKILRRHRRRLARQARALVAAQAGA